MSSPSNFSPDYFSYLKHCGEKVEKQQVLAYLDRSFANINEFISDLAKLCNKESKILISLKNLYL
jgi:hypothetical protein